MTLWMGVPVVALNGSRHSGRVGACLLTSIGAGDLIGNDIDEYLLLMIKASTMGAGCVYRKMVHSRDA
jgi:predicted O-linked N-acetylglucosamine transferase (SPINDLY family)